jgi:DNA-binding transcriptional MerR regulator
VHTISQVARMSGVTARTLRHYDELGLLRPARVSANGYRWYGREELLRLQRILLLRQLGVPLPQIAQILAGTQDEVAALRAHRTDLTTERDRLDQLVRTLDHTIASLMGGAELPDEEYFAGFSRRRRALRDDLVERYGQGVVHHFAAADAVTAGWTRADHERAAAQGRDLLERLARARADGHAVASDAVLELMAEHYRAVRALWPAGAAEYEAMADLIVRHPGQRAMIEEVDPALPPWLAGAIRAYVTHRLGPAAPGDLRPHGDG